MKLSLIIISSFYCFLTLAQELPPGCQVSELKKLPDGENRYKAAVQLHGSGKVDPATHPSKEEHGISRADLKKEIIYYNPIQKSCSFSTLEATPFGKWVGKELQWRELQKLVPRDLNYHPVEMDAAYSAKYWRTLPLTAQASLFDRRAAMGMNGLIESGTRCVARGGKSSAELLKNYAEEFTQFYQANLADFISVPK